MVWAAPLSTPLFYAEDAQDAGWSQWQVLRSGRRSAGDNGCRSSFVRVLALSFSYEGYFSRGHPPRDSAASAPCATGLRAG